MQDYLEQRLRCNLGPSEYGTLKHQHTTDGLNIFHIAINMKSRNILQQIVTNVPGKNRIYVYLHKTHISIPHNILCSDLL